MVAAIFAAEKKKEGKKTAKEKAKLSQKKINPKSDIIVTRR
ncbi:MAG: hypothetical protein ACREVA_04535 [Burkholderiales bacterium]